MRTRTTPRTLLALTVAATLATSLTACGGSSGGSTNQEVSGEVTLLTPIFEGSSGKELLEGTLLPQFYEENPDVTVTVDYTTYGNLNTKMTTAIASGLVPDVSLMGVGWVENFAENGVLANLSEEGISADTLPDTEQRVLDAGTYEGDLYAVPIMLDGRFGVARKDILAEAGYDSPPQTVEELREMAKALTQRDASGKLTRAGFDILSVDTRQTYETMLFSQGGDLFNEDATAPEFNSPQGVEALQLMTDLISVDKVVDIGFSSPDATVNPLINGRAAMGVAHNNLWTQAQEADPSVLEQFVPFLIPGEEPSMFFGGTLATMSSRAQNPAAAQALLEFLASPGPALAANEQRGNIPALTELQDSEYVQANPLVQFAMENLDVAENEGGPAQWLEIRGDFTPALESALTGQRTPQEALDGLAADAQSAMDS